MTQEDDRPEVPPTFIDPGNPHAKPGYAAYTEGLEHRPALVANRFVVIATDTGARIAFAEEVYGAGKPPYHSAVIMQRQDAIELAETILRAFRERDDGRRE